MIWPFALGFVVNHPESSSPGAISCCTFSSMSLKLLESLLLVRLLALAPDVTLLASASSVRSLTLKNCRVYLVLSTGYDRIESL